MALTDIAIRKATATGKVQRHTDGGGLYLEVSPAAGKWWRFKYRHGGKEKRLSLGTCPDTGLADARAKHAATRKVLAAGIDPGEQREAQKLATQERGANTFAAVAAELLAPRAKKLAPGSAERERRLLETDLAQLGRVAIADVTAPMLLRALRKVEHRGAVETAHRARMLASHRRSGSHSRNHRQLQPGTDRCPIAWPGARPLRECKSGRRCDCLGAGVVQGQSAAAALAAGRAAGLAGLEPAVIELLDSADPGLAPA